MEDAPVVMEMASDCIDDDHDGYGVGSGCLGSDCNDADFFVFPGAPEACDAVDNDCDQALSPDEVDHDGDGRVACFGFVDRSRMHPEIVGGGDCAPNDANRFLTCTGGCVDADNDGAFVACDAYVSVSGPDCDDSDPSRYPLAPEIPDDGFDQDCSGQDLTAATTAVGVFVDVDAPQCATATGTRERPYCTLAAAISPGATVFVADGTYPGGLDLGSPGMRVYGGYTSSDWSRDPAMHVTTIEGDATGLVLHVHADGIVISGLQLSSTHNGEFSLVRVSAGTALFERTRVYARQTGNAAVVAFAFSDAAVELRNVDIDAAGTGPFQAGTKIAGVTSAAARVRLRDVEMKFASSQSCVYDSQTASAASLFVDGLSLLRYSALSQCNAATVFDLQAGTATAIDVSANLEGDAGTAHFAELADGAELTLAHASTRMALNYGDNKTFILGSATLRVANSILFAFGGLSGFEVSGFEVLPGKTPKVEVYHCALPDNHEWVRWDGDSLKPVSSADYDRFNACRWPGCLRSAASFAAEQSFVAGELVPLSPGPFVETGIDLSLLGWDFASGEQRDIKGLPRMTSKPDVGAYTHVTL